jgi:hypothetical protein
MYSSSLKSKSSRGPGISLKYPPPENTVSLPNIFIVFMGNSLIVQPFTSIIEGLFEENDLYPPWPRLAGNTDESYSIPFSASISNAQLLSSFIENPGARKYFIFSPVISSSIFMDLARSVLNSSGVCS